MLIPFPLGKLFLRTIACNVLTEAATGLSQRINPYYLYDVTPAQTLSPAQLRPKHANATAACVFKGGLFIYYEFQVRSAFEEVLFTGSSKKQPAHGNQNNHVRPV